MDFDEQIQKGEWIEAKECWPPVSWPAVGFTGVTPLVIKLVSGEQIENAVWDGNWIHSYTEKPGQWQIINYRQLTHWRLHSHGR